MNQSSRPIGRSALSRRRLLAGGGLLAAGCSAEAGSLTLVTLRSLARRRGHAAVPAVAISRVSQWYREKQRGAARWRRSSGTRRSPRTRTSTWSGRRRLERALAAALLTDEGPDVFEWVNGPNIDMIKGGQVVT